MPYLKNGQTSIGGVCAKVAGNEETNHMTEYWPQGSRVRYANELIKYADVLYLKNSTT